VSDLIPWRNLGTGDRVQIMRWLEEHRIDPMRVPIDALPEYDPATGEWLIPVFRENEHGRSVVNPDGETIRTLVVRSRELRPLPWPRVRLRIGGDR
jgi:hypothetical protein